MRNVKVTKHAKNRTKNRVGISKKLADKNAKRAFAYGLTHAECKGNLKKYITKVFFSSDTHANNIRVYHRYVYIFTGNRLITILELPTDLYQLADKLEKEKEKNMEERLSLNDYKY